eukprot:TRINITY_DN5743_c0_g2_i13.p1 TRINITY_DN5743_c0_g2~~TRINITY_DN5743_c0_g2_i13.p1  ORF type:complete len:322 (+),score=38.63 TRINITY_DN5743_c0_g2_i13:111-968(+)
MDRVPWYLKTHKRCFVASEAVSLLMERLGWSEEQAIFFGRLLRIRHIVHHVDDDQVKFGNDCQWWRFQSHEEGPLNWKQIWIQTIDESPAVLAEELYQRLLLLIQAVLPPNPGTPHEIIQYLKKLENREEFKQWELSTSVLQKVQLKLSSLEKLSFWLNTYNMLALHSILQNAFQDVDVVASFFRRLSFFKSCYLVSGYEFSLDDIEHGILRPTNDHFKSDDPRACFKLLKPDPRIFSVMTCYNISSPCPIVIPPTGTENMLRFAEQMYFQKQVVIEENTVPQND